MCLDFTQQKNYSKYIYISGTTGQFGDTGRVTISGLHTETLRDTRVHRLGWLTPVILNTSMLYDTKSSCLIRLVVYLFKKHLFVYKCIYYDNVLISPFIYDPICSVFVGWVF